MTDEESNPHNTTKLAVKGGFLKIPVFGILSECSETVMKLINNGNWISNVILPYALVSIFSSYGIFLLAPEGRAAAEASAVSTSNLMLILLLVLVNIAVSILLFSAVFKKMFKNEDARLFEFKKIELNLLAKMILIILLTVVVSFLSAGIGFVLGKILFSSSIIGSIVTMILPIFIAVIYVSLSVFLTLPSYVSGENIGIFSSMKKTRGYVFSIFAIMFVFGAVVKLSAVLVLMILTLVLPAFVVLFINACMSVAIQLLAIVLMGKIYVFFKSNKLLD